MSSVDTQNRNYKRMGWGVVGAGFAASFVYGWQTADTHPIHHAIAAVLIAAAPFALGGLAGFLFGIPKTLQGDGTNGGPVGRRHGWQANTNLEQVSDWLTKILIGVGLTQLREIPESLQDTGDYVAHSLGGAASPAIVTAMLVSFSALGFVIAYLLTKFDLGVAIDVQDGLLDELSDAIIKNPNDRNAVESYMLSTLYLEPPEGFDRAIQTGQSFLGQEGHPQAGDGNIFAYLACAYGQKYRDGVAKKSSQADLDAIRDQVVASANEAITRIPEWKARLRQLANPPVGSKDDDLVALKDDPKLRTLLGIGT